MARYDLRSMGGEFEGLSGSLYMRLLPIRRGSGHETFLRSIKPLRKALLDCKMTLILAGSICIFWV